MAAKKFRCKKCAYIHKANTPPDVCPVCNAPASEFEVVTEDKKPDTNSNTYTILYATAMVILVALLLAFTSQSLSSIQKTNEDNDKRQQILRSVKINVSAGQAEEKYNELIKNAFLVDTEGKRVAGDAFAEDVEKAFARGIYPVFVADIDGNAKYILAMRGAGLWGPLWGYIAVNDDCNTIFGADFSHASETPGLGAEITTAAFSGQFAGKELFKEGVFKSVAVIKSGYRVEGQDYVDAISGGTITSNGVHEMLQTSLSHYSQFLTTQK